MIKLRIEEILREKRITKSAFAEMLGVKKQNLNGALETKNLDRIQEIANLLGVDYLELITEKQEEQKPTIHYGKHSRRNLFYYSLKLVLLCGPSFNLTYIYDYY